MTAKELSAELAARGARFHGPRVIVVREKGTNETKSGLIVVREAQRKQQWGAVLAFGSQSEYREGGKLQGEVNIGDYIYIPNTGGVVLEQPLNGKVYLLEGLHDVDIYLTYVTKKDIVIEDEGSQTTTDALV